MQPISSVSEIHIRTIQRQMMACGIRGQMDFDVTGKWDDQSREAARWFAGNVHDANKVNDSRVERLYEALQQANLLPTGAESHRKALAEAFKKLGEELKDEIAVGG